MTKIITAPATSSATWVTLETFARAQVQHCIQQLLEDEVTELLGRQKSERRAAVDAPTGARNGHGKPRQLALMNGTGCHLTRKCSRQAAGCPGLRPGAAFLEDTAERRLVRARA